MMHDKGGPSVEGTVAEYDLVIVGAGTGNVVPDETWADWR